MLPGSDVQNSIIVLECMFCLIGGDTVAIYFPYATLWLQNLRPPMICSEWTDWTVQTYNMLDIKATS